MSTAWRIANRPQHAGVACVGIEVGELADRAGGLDEGLLVVEVGQRERRGAHEDPLPRATVRLVHVGRLGAGPLR